MKNYTVTGRAVKLSAAQLAALRFAAAADGRLYRWPGGFWIAEPPPDDKTWAERGKSARMEKPYTTIHTVRGLESRGLLTRLDAAPLNEWRATRELTDAGRAAITTTEEPPK